MRNPTLTKQTMRTTGFPANRFLPHLAALGLLALTAGCLYRMPVQQGNYLNPTQVAQLENGMTRSQVSFLLGTPMVPSGFNSDRWDYYYYINARSLKEPVTSRLTVYFKDDKVERVDNYGAPVTAEAAALASEVEATQDPKKAAGKLPTNQTTPEGSVPRQDPGSRPGRP